eukprot:9063258-Pyramimonas_sp.AAC.1
MIRLGWDPLGRRSGSALRLTSSQECLQGVTDRPFSLRLLVLASVSVREEDYVLEWRNQRYSEHPRGVRSHETHVGGREVPRAATYCSILLNAHILP